jgi:hypothetical protein
LRDLSDDMQVGQVPVALVEVEPVADEELVGDREADVPDRQVLHDPPVRPVEERDGGERRGRAQRQRAAEVVERQAGVDDVLDEQDVPAGDLLVEVLEETGLPLAPGLGAAVAGELDEVDVVEDRQRPGEVGQEDGRGLQRGDEEGFEAFVVGRDVVGELADSMLDRGRIQVDVADAGVVQSQGCYDASLTPKRCASRSMSRL